MGKAKRGGAGTVYTERPADEKPDGTVVKSYQRMPTQLLHEWTQGQQRPKPFYRDVRPLESGRARSKVVLPDAKDHEKNLEFTCATDAESGFTAKEHAALLALLHVCPTLPLQRKLPDPYAELWTASAQAAPKSKAEPKSRAAKAAPAPKAGGKAASRPSAAAAARDDEDWDGYDDDGAYDEYDISLQKAASGPAPRRSAPAASGGGAKSSTASAGGGWRGSSGAAEGVLRATSQFVSKAEREAAQRQRQEERQQVINKREARAEMKRRQRLDTPIILTKRMRLRLHDALGLGRAYDQAEAADINSLLEDMSDEHAEAASRCLDWGFAPQDVGRALAAARAGELDDEGRGSSPSEHFVEQLRKWLCLHVPEEELPEMFAAGRGQFEVRTQASNRDLASASKPPAAKDEFVAQRAELLVWLKTELEAAGSDGGDVAASVDSAALVLESVSAADSTDDDAAEAGQNAAEVLVSLGAPEAVGTGLRERWEALWAARKAHSGTLAGDMKAATAPAGTSEAGGDATADTAEAEAAEDQQAPARRKRQKGSGLWFGASARSGRSSREGYDAWLQSAEGKRLQQHRDKLPAAKSREDLLRLIRSQQVVLVQGETGCGKTTQVGQYLIEADTSARVVVTQPRRVAAVSVAQRVAEERGETVGSGEVGYSVRGETRLCRDRGRLLFCTNGVLLRRVLSDPAEMFSPDTCTHLVVDEVHERSIEIDFLLTLLCHLLETRPSLRVVLMSATMDVEQVAKLFSRKSPVVKIPGRTFPVEQRFLEEAEEHVGAYYTSAASKARGSGEAGDGAGQGPAPLPFLDLPFIAKLVLAALRGQVPGAPEDGAVLVFVPGVGEINRLIEELNRGANTKQEILALPLHGALPSDQQRRCFEVPRRGGPRKVVVATNVAETSVTLPDVTIVIDTARERRLSLEPGAAAPCLAETLCAQASLKQRKGRAGRVRAGLCMTLLPRKDVEALRPEAPPEIEACPLDTLCLQVRAAGFEPASFLAWAPTPPRPERVQEAEEILQQLGATRPKSRRGASDEDKSRESKAADTDAADATLEVAPLGWHLAALPCDARLGKLLVVGAFLGVAPIATDVAAMLSVRSPLKSTARDANAAAYRDGLRKRLRPGGTRSDHCLLAQLMQLWQEAGGAAARRELCQKAGLVFERMAEAASLRSQYMGALRSLGFDTSGADSHSDDKWRALRAVVCAAFYPQVARVERPPAEFTGTMAGAVEKEAEAKRLRYFVRPPPSSMATRDIRGFLHPSSVLFTETSCSGHVVFSSSQLQQTPWEAQHPTKLVLSDVSDVSVFALLLFGGALQVDAKANEVTIDGWATFSGGSTTVVALMEKLRTEIDVLLLRKAEEPSLRLGGELVAQAVSELIGTEGLGHAIARSA